MKTENYEALITKKTLAELLNVHPRTLTRMMNEGRLPFLRVGKVAVRFRLSDVLVALEDQGSSHG